MDESKIIDILQALGQGTRLGVFRRLVAAEPLGLAAGDMARRLGVPHNTLSTHLAALERAGLITSQRHSRSIVYRADIDQLRAVVMYLLKDCCGGKPELCQPLISELMTCCEAGAGCG